MVSDGKGKCQIPVFTFLYQSSGTRLLKGYPYRSMKIRIGGAINRRKVIKNFTSEIERPYFIQFLDLVFRYHFIELIGKFGHNGTFCPFGGWLQIIGAIGAHFMEINVDVGVPLMKELQP